MPRHKKVTRFITPFITVAAILGVSALLIAYGRGYRPSFGKDGTASMRPTGLLSTTSDPTGAQVFLDGKLLTATNQSVNVDPGDHTVLIAKEGYLNWEKHIHIDPEVVSRADAFLFPINPSLSPLTSTGISSPILSSDGTKVVYIIPPKSKTASDEKIAGIWEYDLVDRPLGFNRDPRQVASWSDTFDLSTATIRWSPDSTQLMVSVLPEYRLYTLGKVNDFQIITNTIDDVVAQWKTEVKTKETQRLSAFKPDIINFATESAHIISFSPDETKFIYEATASASIPPVIVPPMIGTNSTPEVRSVIPGKIYVYDSKEDKNYFLFDKQEILPTIPTPTIGSGGNLRRPTPIPTPTKGPPPPVDLFADSDAPDLPFRWFPTNRHILLTLPGKIDILEYDRTNWVTLYAGPFVNNFAAPWPGGSRIVIVTNLNPGSSPLPNLYTVNLR